MTTLNRLFYLYISSVRRLTSAWRWAYVNVVRRLLGSAGQAGLSDITVLYQSDHFTVIDKRYDVKINSNDASDKVTVALQLEYLFPERVDESAQHGFRFVHRLDYATSGILCVATTKTGARWASKVFENRGAMKHYLALVRGHVDPSVCGKTIDEAIGQDSSITDICKMCVSREKSCVGARHASTTMYLLQHGMYEHKPASKVLLVPHTGRTHQLRVHCAFLGHVIVGDYTYSNRQDVTPYRMMLQSHRLVLPMKQEHIDVTAPDPFIPEKDPKWNPSKTFMTYSDFIHITDINHGNMVVLKQKPKTGHHPKETDQEPKAGLSYNADGILAHIDLQGNSTTECVVQYAGR